MKIKTIVTLAVVAAIAGGIIMENNKKINMNDLLKDLSKPPSKERDAIISGLGKDLNSAEDKTDNNSSDNTEFFQKVKSCFKSLINYDKKKPNGSEINKEVVYKEDDKNEVTSAEEELTIEDELNKNKDSIGYSLHSTKLILDDSNFQNVRINYISTYKNWKDTFETCGCKNLLEQYEKLMNEKEINFDETDNEKLVDFLNAWILYFQNDLKIYEYIDDSTDENGCVTVTVENRRFYVNGKDFKDGEVCSVRRKPWIYNEVVYYDGILDTPKKSQELLTEEE